MNYRNHSFIIKINKSSQKSIHSPKKINNSKDNRKKDIIEKLKFDLNKINNNNYIKNSMRYKSINLKIKNKKNKNLKLSFSKNSQTTLKNYNYKYNGRNEFLNYSLCNSKIIKSKIKTSKSAKEINKIRKISKNNGKIHKLKILNSNKSLIRINDNIFFRQDKKKDINMNMNKLYIKNNENYSENSKINELNNFEIFKDLNENKTQKYKSGINIFNMYKNNIKNDIKFINLKSNMTFLKYNSIFNRKDFININQNVKKSNWKNNILENIITNITKVNKNVNNINFYDDNYNHQNIKMFTILDLYNKKH